MFTVECSLDVIACRGTLKQQANSPDWGHLVRELLSEGIQKPK